MVRDGLSFWTQTYTRNFDTRREQHFVCRVPCLHLKHVGESTQSFQRNISKRVKSCNSRTVRILLIPQKPMASRKELFDEWKGGAATAMFQSGLPEERWDSTVTCCCYLQKSARHGSRWQDSYGDTIGATFDGEVVLFWSKRQIRTHLFQKRVSVTSVRIEDVNWTTHGICLTCGEEDGHVICSSQIAKIWKTCQPPKSASKNSNTKKFHRKNLCHFHMRGRYIQASRSSSSLPW